MLHAACIVEGERIATAQLVGARNQRLDRLLTTLLVSRDGGLKFAAETIDIDRPDDHGDRFSGQLLQAGIKTGRRFRLHDPATHRQYPATRTGSAAAYRQQLADSRHG